MFDKKIRWRRQVWALTYVIWLALIIVLIVGVVSKPHGGLRAPSELLHGVHLAEEVNWMSVHLDGNKIGVVRSELEPLDDGGYELREFSNIQAVMMGTLQKMSVRMTVRTDSTLAMRSFEGLVEVSEYSTSFSGEIHDKSLQLQMNTGGQITEKAIPAPEPIYLSQAIKPLLQAGRLNKSDSLKLAGFDPLSLDMQDMVVIGAHLEPHRLWGEDVIARKLTTRMSGMESTVFVDKQGNTLAEFGPMGMIMRRVDEEDANSALSNDFSSVDFLSIYAIKPKGKIDGPRKANHAQFRVTGFDLTATIESSDRQSISRKDKELLVVSRLPDKAGESLKNRKRFLRDVPFIESRNPAIKAAAIEAVAGAKTRIDSLEFLTRWVFKEVKKRPSAGLPSALGVLNQKVGDCNEHSVLFTAMARSLGIPTRLQLGVVYQKGMFYYHAWTASWVEDRWVEFDPTFGQIRADAARIALASGNLMDSMKLVNAIGNIGIEIIDVK